MLLGGTLSLQANPITRAEARLVAQELVGINDTETDNVPVAPYYIFSRGQGQGYVIVSGDDTTAPILGYTEQGDFDAAQLPPQLQAMLGAWGKAISEVQAQRKQVPTSLRRARARAIADYKQEWKDVPALVETHWHQSTPYNNLAPVKEGSGRCMTGCVATAGSQVAYYFRRDNNTELQYDTPTYGYGTPITVSLPKGTPLRWDLMKKSGTGTARQDSAVAVLMYALGTSAWLTYGDGDGTATSGYNYKMGDAMRGQLGLNYDHRYKEDMSERSWETLIYNNLATRRPMLYSGYSESQGGHSVVLDGYQARTGLYHFNFGWGGQSDGWYTVDNETGMNGFNQYMDLVYNITPQRPNVSASISVETIYHRAPTTVKVSVANNGTLDFTGVNLQTNTQPVKPTNAAIAKDQTTTIAPDESGELELTMTQVSKRSELYLFLSDNNGNLLDSCLVSVTPTVADLRMQKMTLDASDEVQTLNGVDYKVVNNTVATITATLLNGDGGTFCMPSVQCELYKLGPATGEWTSEGASTVSSQTFEVGEEKDVVFSFPNLKEGMLYKAVMNTTVKASENTELQMGEGEGEVFFTVRASDLTVTSTGRTAVVSGRWNETLFSQLASDATVCSYDISALTQLNTQPVAANPNAVFYASADATDLLRFNNVVVGEQCRSLVVRNDAEFQPSKAFTAERASLVLANARTDFWQPTFVPFAVQVPYGMQVRKATGVESITVTHEQVTEVEPLSVVLFLTGHAALDSLTGTQVAVTTDAEVSLFDGKMVASAQNRPMPEGAKVMGVHVGTNYYINPDESQTQLDAFQPALVGVTATRLRVSNEPAVENYYCQLAKAINHVYEGLAQKGEDEAAGLSVLRQVLKQAEDMLTYRSHSAQSDITGLAAQPEQVLEQYLNGHVDGICQLPTADAEHAGASGVYSLSGQRLSGQPVRGITIVVSNGKARKLMVR